MEPREGGSAYDWAQDADIQALLDTVESINRCIDRALARIRDLEQQPADEPEKEG